MPVSYLARRLPGNEFFPTFRQPVLALPPEIGLFGS